MEQVAKGGLSRNRGSALNVHGRERRGSVRHERDSVLWHRPRGPRRGCAQLSRAWRCGASRRIIALPFHPVRLGSGIEIACINGRGPARCSQNIETFALVMRGGLLARGGLATRLLEGRTRPAERRLTTGAQDFILPHMARAVARYFANVNSFPEFSRVLYHDLGRSFTTRFVRVSAT
jgi:hypothetical protein